MPVGSFVDSSLPKPIIGMVRQYTNPWPTDRDMLGGNVYKGEFTLEKPLIAGAYQGLFGDPTSMTATCVTGNCTWTSYKSLGVCNQCLNISNSIQANNMSAPVGQQGPYFLDNGLQLTDSTQLINSSTSINLSHIGYIPWSLLNISIMSFDAAYECSLYWCVNEYNSSMQNGRLLENRTQTWSKNNLKYQDPKSIDNMTPTCQLEARLGDEIEQGLSLSPGSCDNDIGCCFIDLYTNGTGDPEGHFKVDYMTHFTLKTFLEESLGGNISLPEQTTAYYTPKEMKAFAALPRLSPTNGGSDTMKQAIANMTLVDIPELIDNVTNSITTRMRQAMGPHDPGNAWNGTSHQAQPMLQVKFWWLLYPACLLLAAFGFLLASITINTRSKTVLWKSSMTALLFSGLAEEHRTKAADHDRLSELDDLAEELKVMLERTDKGWRLT